MVVLVIMGLLAGLVTIGVRGRMILAKQNAAKTELATIRDAIETFYTVEGRYPSSEEGIDVLVARTDKIPEPLLSTMPLDPWSNRYAYNAPGRNGPFEIICLGADGREGGEGADEDLSSDRLRGDG